MFSCFLDSKDTMYNNYVPRGNPFNAEHHGRIYIYKKNEENNANTVPDTQYQVWPAAGIAPSGNFLFNSSRIFFWC